MRSSGAWGITDPCRAGDVVDLVFEPEVHEWYGEHVQLICRDIREENEKLLSRDLLVEIYKKLTVFLKDLPRPVKEVQSCLMTQGGFEKSASAWDLPFLKSLSSSHAFPETGKNFTSAVSQRKSWISWSLKYIGSIECFRARS